MPSAHYFSDDQVRDWVNASCQAQGVPVKVTDALVVRRVGTLLGAGSEGAGLGGGGAAHAAAAARTRSTARPARAVCASEPPKRVDAGRVEASGTGHSGEDDGVIEDGPDDRGLAVEVERVPRSA